MKVTRTTLDDDSSGYAVEYDGETYQFRMEGGTAVYIGEGEIPQEVVDELKSKYASEVSYRGTVSDDIAGYIGELTSEDLRHRAERNGVARYIGQSEIYNRSSTSASIERDSAEFESISIPVHHRTELGLDFGLEWKASTSAKLKQASAGDISSQTLAYVYQIGTPTGDTITFSIADGGVYSLAASNGSPISPKVTTPIASVNDGEWVEMTIKHDPEANEVTWVYEGESDSATRTQDVATWSGVSSLDDMGLTQNGRGLVWVIYINNATDIRVSHAEFLQE